MGILKESNVNMFCKKIARSEKEQLIKDQKET